MVFLLLYGLCVLFIFWYSLEDLINVFIFFIIFVWLVLISFIVLVFIVFGCLVVFCIISIGLFRLGVFFCILLEFVSIV